MSGGTAVAALVAAWMVAGAMLGVGVGMLLRRPRTRPAHEEHTLAPGARPLHWWATFAPPAVDARLGAAVVAAAVVAPSHAWILVVGEAVAAWATADLFMTEPLVTQQIRQIAGVTSWVGQLIAASASQLAFTETARAALRASADNPFVAARRSAYEQMLDAPPDERERVAEALVLAARDPLSALADDAFALALRGEGIVVTRLFEQLGDLARIQAESYAALARDTIGPDIAQGRAMAAVLLVAMAIAAYVQRGFFATDIGLGLVVQLLYVVTVGIVLAIAASARVPFRWDLVFR